MPYSKPLWETAFGKNFAETRPSWRSLCRKAFTEFLATTLLIFSASCSAGELLSAVTCIGFTVCILVACFGGISGCHMNPAVSLAMLIAGVLSGFVEFFIYCFSQLLGSVTGASVAWAAVGNATFASSVGGMTVMNTEQASIGQGILFESILTFQLALVYLLTSQHSQTAAIFVGFSMTLGMILAASVTGGSMNPARSLGPSLVFQLCCGQGFLHHYVYWVGPFLGSVLAACSWKLIFGDEKHRWPIMEKIFGAKDENFVHPKVKLRRLKTASETVSSRSWGVVHNPSTASSSIDRRNQTPTMNSRFSFDS